MTSGRIAATDQARAQAPPPPTRTRVFYTGAALLLLAITFAGFMPFYLRGRAYLDLELRPAIRGLLITHGIAMTLWMLLFVVQSLLIATRNRRTHMFLGQFGIALLVIIVALGLHLSIVVTRITDPAGVIAGLLPKPFLLVLITVNLMIALFGGIGLWFRKRPEIHRPMMLLAALSAMPAPISRIYSFNMLYEGTRWERLFGEAFGTLIVGAILLIAHSLLTRSVNRAFALGYATLFFASVAAMRLANTSAWNHIATLLLR
jgi:hypothetical protein